MPISIVFDCVVVCDYCVKLTWLQNANSLSDQSTGTTKKKDNGDYHRSQKCLYTLQIFGTIPGRDWPCA